MSLTTGFLVSAEFAKLTGLSFGHGRANETATTSSKMRSRTIYHLDDSDGEPPDEQADDELVLVLVDSVSFAASAASLISRRSSGSTGTAHVSAREIVRPIVTVRSEHSTVERSAEVGHKQHLTCMISIELPARHSAPAAALELLAQTQTPRSQRFSASPLPVPAMPAPASAGSLRSAARPRSPAPSSTYSDQGPHVSTGAVQRPPDALATALKDLRERMADWKGHSLEEFGTLRLVASFNVRKDTTTRDFVVYLFEEAILCVSDEKRKSSIVGRSVDTIAPSTATDKLRLKGRVYLRHVRAIADTSTEDELSLTILMTDDAVAQFVMIFPERSKLEAWKAQIESLLPSRPEARPRVESMYPQTPASAYSPPRSRREVTSDLSASDRSESTASTAQTRTNRSSVSPASSTIPEEPSYEEDFGAFISQQTAESSSPPPVGLGFASHLHPSMESRRDFPSTDLMVVISVPPASAGMLKIEIIKNALQCLVANAGPLTRIALVAYTTGEGPKGMLRKTPFLAVGRPEGRKRLEAAIEELAQVVKTPTALFDHKEERVSVVTACNLALDAIMQRKASQSLVEADQASWLTYSARRCSQAKSALTGFVLVNEGRDGAGKQQMDLIMARAEAAKYVSILTFSSSRVRGWLTRVHSNRVPIHAIGYGRSHDPSSLWLLSNHTAGSYTFVKDFCQSHPTPLLQIHSAERLTFIPRTDDIRDALLGCVGGILSIAVTHLRLHVQVPESRWFRVRKVSGTPGAVVAQTGIDVDIDLGEMRHGERKDLVVEVEMCFDGYEPRSTPGSSSGGDYGLRVPPAGHARDFSSATDTFFMTQAGIDLSVLDAPDSRSLYADEYDMMPDEIPLFQVSQRLASCKALGSN